MSSFTIYLTSQIWEFFRYRQDFSSKMSFEVALGDHKLQNQAMVCANFESGEMNAYRGVQGAGVIFQSDRTPIFTTPKPDLRTICL